MSTNRVFTLRDSVYGASVLVLAESDITVVQASLKVLAPRYVSDECNDWRGCTWALGEADGAKPKTFIVALKSWDAKNPEDIGVLVHEMLHVTAALFREIGMKLNSGSEEAYTYFHEWLVVEALKGLNS